MSQIVFPFHQRGWDGCTNTAGVPLVTVPIQSHCLHPLTLLHGDFKIRPGKRGEKKQGQRQRGLVEFTPSLGENQTSTPNSKVIIPPASSLRLAGQCRSTASDPVRCSDHFQSHPNSQQTYATPVSKQRYRHALVYTRDGRDRVNGIQLPLVFQIQSTLTKNKKVDKQSRESPRCRRDIREERNLGVVGEWRVRTLLRASAHLNEIKLEDERR